jgi:hypothetical protein
VFDRFKGRLTPAEYRLRRYRKVNRIFSGAQQVGNAVAAIHHLVQRHFTTGVMPMPPDAFAQ